MRSCGTPIWLRLPAMMLCARARCCLLMLCIAAASAAAPDIVWKGRLFNYQLGQLFNVSRDYIPGVSVYFIDG